MMCPHCGAEWEGDTVLMLVDGNTAGEFPSCAVCFNRMSDIAVHLINTVTFLGHSFVRDELIALLDLADDLYDDGPDRREFIKQELKNFCLCHGQEDNICL